MEGYYKAPQMGVHPPGEASAYWVFLTEDPSHPPLGRLAGRLPSSQPRVACLPRTLVSQLSVGAGLEAEESKVTPNPDVLVGGCTVC